MKGPGVRTNPGLPGFRWLGERVWSVEHAFEHAKADTKPGRDARLRIMIVFIGFAAAFGFLGIGAVRAAPSGLRPTRVNICSVLRAKRPMCRAGYATISSVRPSATLRRQAVWRRKRLVSGSGVFRCATRRAAGVHARRPACCPIPGD